MECRLVSIIIPCYNSEAFIDRCINSLIAQTYMNWEAILIDDGSSDNTLEKCRDRQASEPRIKIIHQDNSGVSVARNKGLEAACGDYICFIDSDDWVTDRYIADLVDAIEQSGADMALSGRVLVRLNAAKETYEPRKAYMPQSNIKELFIHESYHNVRGGPVGKLFKADIIRQARLKFIPQIHYLEDAIFVLSYLLNCNSIVTIPSPSYCYELHQGSLVFSVHSFEAETLGFNEFRKISELCYAKFSISESERQWFNDNMLFMMHRQIEATKKAKGRHHRALLLNGIDWHLHTKISTARSFRAKCFNLLKAYSLTRFALVALKLI